MPFLPDRDSRPQTLAASGGITPKGRFVGSGTMAVEVALLSADHRLDAALKHFRNLQSLA